MGVGSRGQFPINGQQLMIQMDSLTSSMMDMVVTTEEVEMEEVNVENVQEANTASSMFDENRNTDEHFIQPRLLQQHQEQLLQHQYHLDQQQQQLEHQRQL